MPQPIAPEHKPKKRKQVQVAADLGGIDPAGHSSNKKSQPEKHQARTDDSAFRIVHSSVVLSIPPVFAHNARAGAEEMLDSLVMRYSHPMEGVVLAHDNLRFTHPYAPIRTECPFAVCTVEFDATVWSPRIGMKLIGLVSLSSPDHVSLLVHRTFNVSLPRHHIPQDVWEFEYGPAENDPEFGAAATRADGAEASGRWVHKVTGDALGDVDGRIEFTVVGLMVANQMLSLVGSIQPDPFSPNHVAQPPPKQPLSPPGQIRVHNTHTGEEDERMDDDADGASSVDQSEEEVQHALEEEKIRKAQEAEAKLAKKLKREKKRQAKEAAGPGQPSKRKKER